MREQASHNPGDLDLDLIRRIEAVCRQFEVDYRADKSPAIGDYLSDVRQEGRAALRAELEALAHELRQEDETIARPEPGLVVGAPIVDLADPPTVLIPGLTSAPDHEPATMATRDDDTVDLGSSATAPSDVRELTRGRYFGDYEI